MEEQIALFLVHFNKLKNETNNSPRNLSWLAKERVDIEDLCYALDKHYRAIAKHLAAKQSKHTFVTVPFENEYQEYERSYASYVLTASAPAKERELRALKKTLDNEKHRWLQSGKTEEDYSQHMQSLLEAIQKTQPVGSAFNPLVDDPAKLIIEMYDLLSFILANHARDLIIPDESYGDLYEKSLGSWHFYRDTIGLDFTAIHRRWRSVPELFIQPHIAQTDNVPLLELYNEAVKSYVFGSKIASLAMCRALTEHILIKHYMITKNDLGTMVALAEKLFPQLKKLNMKTKKNLVNEMLHDFEGGAEVEDRAVIEYLRTIKYLVQNVPKKK